MAKADPKIKYEVLNARYHDREAYIVAQAGTPGAITIATNMAGRGTDIQLGGNLDMKLKSILTGDETPEKVEQIATKLKAEIEEDKQKVLQAGGLYILGTERHESRRIDNQLRGRSGRQGDPGTSKFFLSLEDDLMRIFGSERMGVWLQKLGLPEGEALVHPMISKALEKAQQKVEEHHFDARKSVLKFDNVMNDQRKVIYSQRKELMDVDDVSETIKDMREEYICSIINSYMPYGSAREDWLKEDLQKELLRATGFILPIINWANEPEMDVQEMTQRILDEVEARLKEKNKNVDPELIKIIEKSTLLQVLDQLWKEHIATLDLMRQTIGLRAYGQKDPLNEYKKEAFNMFSMLLASLKEMVTVVICRAGIPDNAQRTMERAQPSRQNIKMQEVHETPKKFVGGNEPQGQASSVDSVRNYSGAVDPKNPQTWGKVARNDLCPCGSGKKFKHCHGKFE